MLIYFLVRYLLFIPMYDRFNKFGPQPCPAFIKNILSVLYAFPDFFLTLCRKISCFFTFCTATAHKVFRTFPALDK